MNYLFCLFIFHNTNYIDRLHLETKSYRPFLLPTWKHLDLELSEEHYQNSKEIYFIYIKHNRGYESQHSVENEPFVTNIDLGFYQINFFKSIIILHFI